MSEPSEAEFDLNSLNDEELTEQVHDDLYNGLKPEVQEATHILLKRGWSAERVLNDALVEGMRIVGIDFRDGILFVPEVLLAANSMKGGMEILRPLLAETGVEPIGKIVIGTVKGDIHDIGKNRLDDARGSGLRSHRSRHQQPGGEVSGRARAA
jgi:methanogenic corrinoid protein MtbC1